MRVALIADIHGNLLALDAALAVLDGEAIDQVVCLGDVALLGPRPAEVLARLRQRAIPCVLGNTDDRLFDAIVPSRAGNGVIDLAPWTAAQLTDADRAYLRACPLERTLPLDADTTLRYFHGSPHSYEDVIAAGTFPAEVRALLGDASATIQAGGHTHRQLVRRDGDILFINPGSVGLPGVGPDHPLLETNRRPAWAEFAIIDHAPHGTRLDLRRLPLDLDALFADAAASGMPHLDWWRSLWG